MAMALVLALAVAVAGCANQPIAPAAPVARPAAQVVEVWEYPASAFPTICMLFKADGTLHFQGGFLYFNVGAWKRDPGSATLSIVLGGSGALPVDFIKGPGQGKAVAASAFDAATRSLRYRIGPATESLQFAGFVFYRRAACSAA